MVLFIIFKIFLRRSVAKPLFYMVKIGEETGSLDEILRKTADFYDEELDTRVQATVALMEPALIVVMGLIIGFIVMSIMLPMFDMYGQLQ